MYFHHIGQRLDFHAVVFAEPARRVGDVRARSEGTTAQRTQQGGDQQGLGSCRHSHRKILLPVKGTAPLRHGGQTFALASEGFHRIVGGGQGPGEPATEKIVFQTQLAENHILLIHGLEDFSTVRVHLGPFAAVHIEGGAAEGCGEYHTAAEKLLYPRVATLASLSQVLARLRP